jgi:hypothetical protein
MGSFLNWQICEDKPEALDQDVVGLSEWPINLFIPRLLQVFSVFVTGIFNGTFSES